MFLPSILLAVMGLVAAEVPSDSPKCDPSLDSALKETFSDPVPTDLLGEASKLGPWSVLTIAAPNLNQLKTQDEVCIHYLVNKNKKRATYTRKMVPGAIPQPFQIEEKDDKFDLTRISDPKNSFIAHTLYFKDGVALISKCCKDCTGDGFNLALAIADEKKEDSETYAAVMEVRKKLRSIKLDVPIGELSSCVDKEI